MLVRIVDNAHITLRPALHGDGRQLAEIAQEAYGKYLDLVDEPPAPLLLDYEEVAAAGRTHVALGGHRLLGMVTVEHQDDHLVLRNLAVRPSAQGRGIGRRLVAMVEEMASEDSLHGVRLWTRAEMTDNVAFYHRLGYVVTHSERTENAHRVFFRKHLRAGAVSPQGHVRASDRQLNGSTQQ